MRRIPPLRISKRARMTAVVYGRNFPGLTPITSRSFERRLVGVLLVLAVP
jgi:hypothetical protein